MAVSPVDATKTSWLDLKTKSYKFLSKGKHDQSAIPGAKPDQGQPDAPLFQNPFKIEDLAVFDDATLRDLLVNSMYGLTTRDLAAGLAGASTELHNRIKRNLGLKQRGQFMVEQKRHFSPGTVKAARQQILDNLFWELIYWKTPALYEELTEGEKLHPGIFRNLKPELKGKTVLDAGAGSGRASFECLRYGAKQVFAMEPSPGLLNILEEKVASQPAASQILPLRGRFDNIPLEDNSVDVALSCSAFTADDTQGGERGLAELQRVTKPGGKVVIIWPRIEDYEWLAQRGFNYVAMPLQKEMQVQFRTMEVARRCANRFYGRNKKLQRFLKERQKAAVPFSVLGFNPPHDYCILTVQK